MSPGLHSEVGRLRRVIVCRSGLAQRRLTPANCHELLFDDKDRCSALLAIALQADCLLIATDGAAVYLHWGVPGQRALHRTSPPPASAQ